jgi:Na+/melibiose symporter-like transporter
MSRRPFSFHFPSFIISTSFSEQKPAARQGVIRTGLSGFIALRLFCNGALAQNRKPAELRSLVRKESLAMVVFLRPRALYVAVFAWISVTSGRFLAVFLEQEASLQETHIGALLAIHQVTNVASSSIVSSWADSMERKYPGKGRAMLLATGVSIGGSVFSLHALKRLFPNVVIFDSFLWFSALRIAQSASSSFIFPVVDGMCLDFLKGHQGCSPKDYGKERLYGAISWAIVNLLIAPGLDYFGFVILYPLGALSTVILIGTIYFYSQGQSLNKSIPPSKTSEDNNTSDEGSGHSHVHETLNMTSLLRILVASWFGFSFMIAVITLSSGQSIVESLVFLYFEYLGSTYTMMGLTVVLTVAFEIPIFHVAPTLLKRFGSGNLLLVASASYIIRVVGYTLVPKGKIGYVLLLEPLHGVTYACTSTASVDFVSSLMPPRYEASGQGLLQLFVGSGSVLGLIFGGFAQEYLGPRLMYRIAALVVFSGSAIFWMTRMVHGRVREEPQVLYDVTPNDDFELSEISTLDVTEVSINN